MYSGSHMTLAKIGMETSMSKVPALIPFYQTSTAGLQSDGHMPDAYAVQAA
jgi:hypothetical protein